jgi:hypothetical protein
MKYIKIFEKFQFEAYRPDEYRWLYKVKPGQFPGTIIGYIYPIGKSWEPISGYYTGDGESIEEIYEYLYNLDAEPKILKKPANFIYFKYNNKIPLFIKNRSEAIKNTDYLGWFIVDEEKEEEMKLFLASKKYNL